MNDYELAGGTSLQASRCTCKRRLRSVHKHARILYQARSNCLHWIFWSVQRRGPHHGQGSCQVLLLKQAQEQIWKWGDQLSDSEHEDKESDEQYSEYEDKEEIYARYNETQCIKCALCSTVHQPTLISNVHFDPLWSWGGEELIGNCHRQTKYHNQDKNYLKSSANFTSSTNARSSAHCYHQHHAPNQIKQSANFQHKSSTTSICLHPKPNPATINIRL